MPHREVPERNRRLGRAMRQAMTPAEFRLWRMLRTRALEGLRFRRQVPLGPYIVDFFCPEKKIVIEVDGGQHGFDANAAYDVNRDAWLRRDGHRVLRFSNRDVMTNLDGVCSTILATVRGDTR